MRALIDVILIALNLYTWVIIAAAIMSWLTAFNIINTRNDLVRSLSDFITRITEPALRTIRRYVPDLGGIDISPIILLLLIYLIQGWIQDYLRPIAF